MRGKGPPVADMWKRSGITPAYAGKREKAWKMRFPQRDHPRLCGEKERNPSEYVLMLGSPPPMRGKDGDSVHSRLPFRITPAYAGKSVCYQQTPNEAEDHPRLCGEKSS